MVEASGVSGRPGPVVAGDLGGVRVVEVADEQAEYCGLLLAGLGADVIKVEPPSGSPTRWIEPYYTDVVDPERSLHFWQYNRGKRSIVLDPSTDRDLFGRLVASADIVIDSRPRSQGGPVELDEFRRRDPRLITVRVTPFGDDGPWADYRASDLVHLALGGPMMNCGYDPQPDGTYDVAPIAPQAWHAYHIAGEQIVTGLLGRARASGPHGRGAGPVVRRPRGRVEEHRARPHELGHAPRPAAPADVPARVRAGVAGADHSPDQGRTMVRADARRAP